MFPMRTAIIIPARLGSTRLPRKMLADVNGKTLIERCASCAIKAVEAGAADELFVSCDDAEIAAVVEKLGVQALMTDPNLPSGTDRVYAGYKKIGKEFDAIVNVQGDQPNFDFTIIGTILAKLDGADITTPVAKLRAGEAENPDVVKAIVASNDQGLYFTRHNVPHGMHHLGIYAYTVPALEKFVALPPSPLEKLERLEQLRALENGMIIKVAEVQNIPISVDNASDLERARAETK